jgi:PAS domain S-box-containing protein
MNEAPDKVRLDALTLRWFNDLAAQGVLTTDAQLRIRGWNHWLEVHSGKSASDMIGRDLLEAFPELVERGLHEYYRAVLAGEVKLLSHRLHRFLLRFGPPGGGSLPHMQQSVRIAPLQSDGLVVGTITVIDDVTERVEREAELKRQLDERVTLLASEQRARETAEEASRLKDEFLATVSHELRTPLNAILGWARLMRDGEVSEESVAKASQVIERNATAQQRLIEDLLDISRIVSGKLRLSAQRVSIQRVVQAAAESAEPTAALRGVTLETQIDPKVGFVSGDPDRLQQVVWNLLTNAVKFSPRGSQVTVRVAAAGENAEIVVQDEGAGIDREFLPYVFDRFRQADGSTSRKHGGLGLGLSIVRHLTEMHGGTVRAESPGEGRGSSFYVTLPLASGDREPFEAQQTARTVWEEPRPGEGASLSGVRVLVVDDERDSREMIAVALARTGASVVGTASAAECLAELGRGVPDVLVADIGMPEVDGYELLRTVRALPPELGGRVPAIALTGYARAEDRILALAAGFQEHVAKPIDLARLNELIVALVGPAGRARGDAGAGSG